MVGAGEIRLMTEVSSTASTDRGVGLSMLRMACETMARSDCSSFPIDPVPVRCPSTVSVLAYMEKGRNEVMIQYRDKANSS